VLLPLLSQAGHVIWRLHVAHAAGEWQGAPGATMSGSHDRVGREALCDQYPTSPSPTHCTNWCSWDTRHCTGYHQGPWMVTEGESTVAAPLDAPFVLQMLWHLSAPQRIPWPQQGHFLSLCSCTPPALWPPTLSPTICHSFPLLTLPNLFFYVTAAPSIHSHQK
jgi:hypothetical protein